jgi:hypothetical protein
MEQWQKRRDKLQIKHRGAERVEVRVCPEIIELRQATLGPVTDLDPRALYNVGGRLAVF